MKFGITILIICLAQGVAAQPDPPVSTAGGTGFVPIFDGSLDNWQGDPVYWTVENHELVGTITQETIVDHNTFIIWRGGSPADFELKVDVKISEDGNSGINYRSKEFDKYRLAGYQCDIDGPNQWSGQNYEEQRRTFLALRGEVSKIGDEGKPTVIGTVGEKDDLTKWIKPNDWNEYHIIAKGSIMIHMINGHVMSIVIDHEEHSSRSGLIGVQVHVGPPMEVRYKNFRLKDLSKE